MHAAFYTDDTTVRMTSVLEFFGSSLAFLQVEKFVRVGLVLMLGGFFLPAFKKNLHDRLQILGILSCLIMAVACAISSEMLMSVASVMSIGYLALRFIKTKERNILRFLESDSAFLLLTLWGLVVR